MTVVVSLAAGAAAAAGARMLLIRGIRAKLERDLAALNAGDHRPLLRGYTDDAVLVFNDGQHRWAGEHRGKAAIERFLQSFTAAGLQGRIRELVVGGAPWALTIAVRFDDHANGPDGEELYRNRVAMVIHTRWGRIVRHEDFYEDTSRIEEFSRRLEELGIDAAARRPEPAAA